MATHSGVKRVSGIISTLAALLAPVLPVQAGDSYTAVDKSVPACYDFDSDGVLDPLTVQSRTTVFNQRDEVVMRSVVNFLAPKRVAS